MPSYVTWERTNECRIKGVPKRHWDTLRALEEGTPWAHKAELYIKLMKEAVRKDMRESHSLLPFWDYCLERRVRVYNLTARDYITV